ncbi:MAG TPA: ABC transporter ATP-binding protein [Candidatus Desulfaltia sp.]|nr:ABC transporter ATP-binding protein [Candidatus Desulfaltia sp.]
MSVRVVNLSFSYKNFTLKVEALKFESAKITAIVGPNGAGKTTFLKCIGAVLPASKGSLFIDGRDIMSLRSQERARLIGYVPQEHDTVFNYQVADFVLMGRAAYISPFALPSQEDIKAAEEALEFVGLSEYTGRSISELSSGERRLVLIARALAQKSAILLMDEPTTFLDPKHETEVLQLVRKLAIEKQKTILVTLHSLEMAVQYADSMVFMKNGEVVASGRPDEIFQEPLLESVYGMRMKILDWNGRKLVLR